MDSFGSTWLSNGFSVKQKTFFWGGTKKIQKNFDEIKERDQKKKAKSKICVFRESSSVGCLHSFFVHFFQFEAFCVSRVVSSFLFLSNEERRGVNRSFILVFDDAEDDDDECEEEEEEEERDDSIFSRLPRNVPPWRN